MVKGAFASMRQLHCWKVTSRHGCTEKPERLSDRTPSACAPLEAVGTIKLLRSVGSYIISTAPSHRHCLPIHEIRLASDGCVAFTASRWRPSSLRPPSPPPLPSPQPRQTRRPPGRPPPRPSRASRAPLCAPPRPKR